MALTMIEKRLPLSLRIWLRGEQGHISAVEFELTDKDREDEQCQRLLLGYGHVVPRHGQRPMDHSTFRMGRPFGRAHRE